MSTIKKPQWKKRVEITQFFYACLIKDSTSIEAIEQETQDYSFNQNQKKVITFFGQNFLSIKQQIKKLLKKDWSWSRLPAVLQAILLTAYCESKVLKRPKAIAIDQALVSCEHYGQQADKKFLNAILDKLL